MTTCPCGSGKDYDACCGPVIAGAPAATAEALMRSRYTAYVKGAIDHIFATYDPKVARESDRGATERWSKESTWHGLKIVATERGGPADEDGVVEFMASHAERRGGPVLIHHERARFARSGVDRRWLYVDGDLVKPAPIHREERPGRNDPCSCGSGKKYKKCHGIA